MKNMVEIGQGQNIEEKIRADKFINDFFSLLEKDVDGFINPYRGKFVRISCPCCDTKKTNEEFTKGKFSFHVCPKCDTLFINPRPTKDMLDHFYINSKAVALFTQELMEKEKYREKYIFNHRVRLIIKFLHGIDKTQGRLIEIGCSIGTFLDIIKQKSKFIVEGVDPSDEAYRACMSKDIKAYKTTLENFKGSLSRYDVALNFETIEHVFSPYRFLCKINSLLKKGGYIGFTTPNRHGFDMMVLGKQYKNIHGPCHLNYFNVDSIDVLMERSGFKVVKKMTPGILDVEVVRKQITEKAALGVSPFLRHLVCEANNCQQANFQKFLSDNCLSGNMLIFAQKTHTRK